MTAAAPAEVTEPEEPSETAESEAAPTTMSATGSGAPPETTTPAGLVGEADETETDTSTEEGTR